MEGGTELPVDYSSDDEEGALEKFDPKATKRQRKSQKSRDAPAPKSKKKKGAVGATVEAVKNVVLGKDEEDEMSGTNIEHMLSLTSRAITMVEVTHQKHSDLLETLTEAVQGMTKTTDSVVSMLEARSKEIQRHTEILEKKLLEAAQAREVNSAWAWGRDIVMVVGMALGLFWLRDMKNSVKTSSQSAEAGTSAPALKVVA